MALGQKPHVEIYGTDYETPDGTCIRDYIHILDLARAHILALDARQSEFYNLGTGGGSSVREVIDACRKMTGKDIPVVEKPRRPGDPPRLIASLGKNKKRTWLEATISESRRHHREARGNGIRNFRTVTGINTKVPTLSGLVGVCVVAGFSKEKRPRKHVPQALLN